MLDDEIGKDAQFTRRGVARRAQQMQRQRWGTPSRQERYEAAGGQGGGGETARHIDDAMVRNRSRHQKIAVAGAEPTAAADLDGFSIRPDKAPNGGDGLMGVMQAGMERQVFGATRNAAGLKVGGACQRIDGDGGDLTGGEGEVFQGPDPQSRIKAFPD